MPGKTSQIYRRLLSYSRPHSARIVLAVVGSLGVAGVDVALQLARGIAHPNVIKYLPLMGDYAILELMTPASFAGKSLKELHLRKSWDVHVVAVSPAGDARKLEAPSVEGPLPAGSMIVLIGESAKLERFQRKYAWTEKDKAAGAPAAPAAPAEKSEKKKGIEASSLKQFAARSKHAPAPVALPPKEKAEKPSKDEDAA